MENILPVLIVLGGLIYKIYQNYQEEMEKARKRQQNLPQKPAGSPKTVNHPPRTNTAQRREVFTPTPAAPKPVYDRQLGRPKPTKIVRKPVDLPEKMVLQQEEPSEVSRLRMQRAQQKLAQKLEVEPVAEAVAEQQNVHFDLRQAVIHAAILERPYID